MPRQTREGKLASARLCGREAMPGPDPRSGQLNCRNSAATDHSLALGCRVSYSRSQRAPVFGQGGELRWLLRTPECGGTGQRGEPALEGGQLGLL